MTLKTREELLARHAARFAAVLNHAEESLHEAAYDMFVESVEQFSGEGGQPQGDSRRTWLGAFHPFSRNSFGRAAFVHAQPNPVGVLSGDLLNSLSYESTFYQGFGYTKTFSEGVDYAKYLLAKDGTENMVPRLVSQHMVMWTKQRSHSLIMGIAAFQRSLL